MNSNATPEARDVVAGLSASGKLSIVAMPQRADTVERTGQAVMALTMCGRPTAGDLIFTRGQFIGRLAMEGRPWPANTLERSAVMAAGLKMFASTQAQGMSNILAAAKGEQSGYLLPNTQEIAKIVAGTSGKLNMAALAIVKTLWDVSFSVNGVTEHETQVLDGETAEDPVTAGIIEEPTRETTPQYTYDYAGWALSEDGEVVNGGSVETDVLVEQEITGFVDGMLDISPAPFVLTEGELYWVNWDGAEHICLCYVDADAGVPLITDIVFDENRYPVSGSFAIMYSSPELAEAEGGVIAINAYDLSSETMFDTSISHTVGISQIATTAIIEDESFTSTLNEEFGYTFVTAGEVGLFEIGKQYTIVWDGATYLCTAQDASAVMEGADCLIGNGTAFGLDGNGEPFIIGLTTGGYVMLMCLTDTAETEHTISISHVDDSADSGGGNTDGLPAIIADTVFYAVFKATLRTYTASFYVNGELKSTQRVPYGEKATPPELTGEDGMVLQWTPDDLTIYGDTDFHGIWTRDYILSGEFTLTYDKNLGTYVADATAKNGFVNGATYVIEWGDEVWTCTARSVDGTTTNGISLTSHNMMGNPAHFGTFFGLAITWNDTNSKGEPFCIAADSNGSTEISLHTLNNVGTIKVNIYAKQ